MESGVGCSFNPCEVSLSDSVSSTDLLSTWRIGGKDGFPAQS